MERGSGFAGRVALVTGAGAGLGAAYARWLAARGALVVVNNRRHPDRPSSAQATVDAIIAAGGEAVVDEHPVEAQASGAAMVQRAMDCFGGLDIIIANAAVGEARPIEETDADFCRRAMDINFFGAIHPVLAALPHMRRVDFGRIVLTTSGAGLFGAHHQTAYAASKMALVGFARALSVELGKTNIRINVVSPYARTKMSSAVLEERLGAIMSPEKVAPVVGWLCADKCDRSGIILSTGAGRVRRTALVETPAAEVAPEGGLDWAILDDLAQAVETRNSRWSATTLIPELMSK